MKAIIAIASLTACIACATSYVDSWPKRITVPDGVAHDPTPEQCRSAGYELRANRPASEVAAEAAAAAVAASNAAAQAAEQAEEHAALVAECQARMEAKSNTVAALRGKYYSATRALCREAGVTETNVLTSAQIETIVLPLMEDGETNAKLKRNAKLAAYMVQLEFLSRVLEREDGADALDRL